MALKSIAHSCMKVVLPKKMLFMSTALQTNELDTMGLWDMETKQRISNSPLPGE